MLCLYGVNKKRLFYGKKKFIKRGDTMYSVFFSDILTSSSTALRFKIH